MILVATGHRPTAFGSYKRFEQTLPLLIAFAKEQLRLGVEGLQPTLVYTGMAQGWDMAVAFACAEERIPFIAAVPFVGQDYPWPRDVQAMYRDLLELAQHVEYVSEPPYSAEKMHRRNEWMVDAAYDKYPLARKALFALWNGQDKGGTSQCVRYAQRRGLYLHNVWLAWLKYQIRNIHN